MFNFKPIISSSTKIVLKIHVGCLDTSVCFPVFSIWKRLWILGRIWILKLEKDSLWSGRCSLFNSIFLVTNPSHLSKIFQKFIKNGPPSEWIMFFCHFSLSIIPLMIWHSVRGTFSLFDQLLRVPHNMIHYPTRVRFPSEFF